MNDGESDRAREHPAEFPDPTPEQQYDLLLRLYYGPDPSDLRRCIKKAYETLQRTMRGVRTVNGGHDVKNQAIELLERQLSDVAARRIADQDAFDDWHRQSCAELVTHYRDHGYHMYIGQAQKWINMSLKHIYVVGEARLGGFLELYRFAHVPIDRIVLGKLDAWDGRPRLGAKWSRVDSYEKYLDVQSWIRRTFEGWNPLAVEFALWSGGE